ncbi:MAG: SpoIID/LytB domain-containing protein [Acidimicrobiia bacterium]|nr:SpoIID/LytB domain-containing protein [Acidimicrobiia bacterium]
MRWRILAGVSLLAALAPAPVARAAVPVLVVDGKGWGHGVGMAQDGAYWMGRAGQSTNQILGHFYPGTSIGRASGTVAVAVLDVPNRDTVVTFPGGGQVQDAQSGTQSAGFPVSVSPGGSVHVWFDGSYHAQAISGSQHAAAAGGGAPGPPSQARLVAYQVPDTSIPTETTTTTPLLPTTPPPKPPTPTTTTRPPPPPPPPPPTTTTTTPGATSGRPLWAVPANGSVTSLPARGREYRGVVSMTATGPLHFVDHIDVEQYLRGMGEVRDPSWPQASLRTQAIAARTYALRSVGGELCDDDRCQVYIGASAEYAAMDKAVSDTRGQVITYGGGLASAVYSANAGGVSATAPEGFGMGAPNYPYLKAGPYTTSDPDPWTVTIALTDLATRFNATGPLNGAHIAQAGPSGRAETVSLDGPADAKVVDAHQFAAGLGLKSTLFTLRIEQADVAPAPPAPADLIQVPPDQLALAPPPPADAVPPIIDPGPLPSGPVKAILPGAGHSDRVRWIAFACLLLAGWALAATHYGFGLVPADARGFVLSRLKRLRPTA